MNDRDALLAAVIADPDDDGPRLAYADWLEEHGGEEERLRAEFIRVQIELTRLPAGDPREEGLLGRELELLDAETSWLAELPELPRVRWGNPSRSHSAFERGFVEWVQVQSWNAFQRHAEAIFTAPAPVRRLGVDFDAATPTTLRLLADSPWLERVVGLDFSYRAYRGMGDEAAEALAGSWRLGNLRAVWLQYDRIGPAGARAVAGSDAWPSLRELYLDGNPLGDAGAAALAGSPRLAGLEVVGLGDTGLTARGAQALAQSPHLAGLRLLDVRSNRLTALAEGRLRRRFGKRVRVREGEGG